MIVRDDYAFLPIQSGQGAAGRLAIQLDNHLIAAIQQLYRYFEAPVRRCQWSPAQSYHKSVAGCQLLLREAQLNQVGDVAEAGRLFQSGAGQFLWHEIGCKAHVALPAFQAFERVPAQPVLNDSSLIRLLGCPQYGKDAPPVGRFTRQGIFGLGPIRGPLRWQGQCGNFDIVEAPNIHLARRVQND